VATYCVHYGEEPMISGRTGSGAIFFSHCSLRCAFCQNYYISQVGNGENRGEMDEEGLAGIMLELEKKGTHNINLVSPTHYAPQIMEALAIARGRGLKLPIVYNTGGYDSVELIKALEGKVDIYLPDFKYADNRLAKKYSGADNYFETAKTGLAEMFRQVGNMRAGVSGIGVRGILVRHLVLPGNLENSFGVLDFLASLSKDIWISLMSQYSPQHRAAEFPELSRPLNYEEYQKVVGYAEKLGLHNLYVQELESSEVYLPNFKRAEPFDPH
ncbi:MAG: radical SAM protein, partial [Candidatus Margulisbacteria bacterium]|nr:radical SAM protein [Candidatus Margulisiibacteriota bacterium]